MIDTKEKLGIIERLTFGQRVAEDEPSLEDYFVETPLWKKLLRGEIDIIYGPKGSGKSAIFHLLTSSKHTPEDVIVIPAENPRGAPIFNGIKNDPPTSEPEFVYLWKLYILSLIASQSDIVGKLEDYNLDLFKKLQNLGVINADKNEILRNALKYIESVKVPNILEVEINSSPKKEERRINVDSALSILDTILSDQKKVAWIAFDRLDSVFDENLDLEENALRALFKAYLDILKYRKIQLKIFLRTDIWDGLTNKGFREASHITRSDHIEWSENNIINLISKRLVNNLELLTYYSLNKESIVSSYAKQLELFYTVYPQQIDSGSKKPDSIKWMMSRVADGSRKTAPRELIHLLNQTKDEQIRSLEIGESLPEGTNLFASSSVKKALPVVSKVRLEQTLFAEYPDFKQYILALDGEKAEHTTKTLASLWGVDGKEVVPIATRLSEIGFFEIRGNKKDPEFWIPFLYRPALNLIQGKAEEDLT